MEIVSRKENKLLNRVEINFRWQHIDSASMTVEPEFIHKRHEQFRSGKASEEGASADEGGDQ